MGDVVSLVEKAAAAVEKDEGEALARKMAKGRIDLDDFAMQLRQLRGMGGAEGVLGLLPGLGKMRPRPRRPAAGRRAGCAVTKPSSHR